MATRAHRSWIVAFGSGVALSVAAGSFAVAATTRVDVVVAVTEDGAADAVWVELLTKRLGPRAALAEAAVQRPLSNEEAAWAALIESRTHAWIERLPEVVALFAPVEPPQAIRVILGNRGGEDAFTHDPTTVGFDLSRLVALYGDGATSENRRRVDRLFVHEYVHLLQKAWLPEHPQPSATPFERAELEIWSEGLGNYFSMSDRWRCRDGESSAIATATLEQLAPRFVDRMVALACANSEEAAVLTADLSSGPFNQKWGALTAALWLELEASHDPGALRRFVQGGVAEVGKLAGRHLPTAALAELTAAKLRSLKCATPAL